MNCHRRVRFQMEGFNMEAVCERKLCPRLFDGGFKDMADIFQGLHCLFMAVAADLAPAGAEFRNGIHNRTARNQAHIQGCFLIHVPQLQCGNRAGRRLNRVDAFLRLESGVCCTPFDCRLKGKDRRCLQDRCPDWSSYIQNVRFLRFHLAEIELRASSCKWLFRRRKEDLDIPVRDFCLLHGTDAF